MSQVQQSFLNVLKRFKTFSTVFEVPFYSFSLTCLTIWTKMITPEAEVIDNVAGYSIMALIIINFNNNTIELEIHDSPAITLTESTQL